MKKLIVFLSLLILAASLCYGVIRLFAIRLAQGDVYPAYSTLRTDGVGSKALHDSLAELMPVERNYSPLSQLHFPEGGPAIFMLGVSRGFEEGTDTIALQALAREGGRVVVAFLPYQDQPHEEETPPVLKKKPEPSPAKKDPKDSKDAKDSKESKDKDSADEKDKEPADEHPEWGVKTAYSNRTAGYAKTGITGLEPELSWHSTMCFDHLDPAWHTLYTNAGKPVVIERTYGKGSVVFVADAYFSSNEALSKERAPGLISALVGNAGRVVFDETHLGVSEHPGVASLAWKYRLQGVVLALAFVAALFVWRNAVSFVPPEEGDDVRGDIVQGAGAAAGFVSLLRRNIPYDKLIGTCLAEWKRSFGHRAKPAILSQVETLAANGVKQPVQAFQMITQILNEKNNANKHRQNPGSACRHPAGSRQGHHRPAGGDRHGAGRHFHRAACAGRGRPRGGQDPAGAHPGAGAGVRV